jgi:hypothetical protein
MFLRKTRRKRMFFEKSHSFVNRHGWTFTHTGEELCPLAANRFREFKEAELKARNIAAKLLQDPTVHHEDKKVLAAKDDIQKFGALAEKCAVWTHEFERTPEREFTLGVNDVLFFNGEQGAGATSKRDSWQFSYNGRELAVITMDKMKELKTLDPETKEEQAEIAEELAELFILNAEFNKNPKKEVNLGLGDVVYFDLAPLLRSDS